MSDISQNEVISRKKTRPFSKQVVELILVLSKRKVSFECYTGLLFSKNSNLTIVYKNIVMFIMII